LTIIEQSWGFVNTFFGKKQKNLIIYISCVTIQYKTDKEAAMGKGLIPDWYLNRYLDATPEFLLQEGIRYLILDIDNTIAPYEQDEPNAENLAWFASLKAAGIRCAFVSNNSQERVALFNQKIGLPMFAKAGKPLSKNMRRAMATLGATREACAIMGDQIFTDCWAGRGVGIRTILVPPIKDKTDLFTRAKRVLERPILKAYRKERENK
jgi:HAD superfamily phosphatase (TIGR01668 family)